MFGNFESKIIEFGSVFYYVYLAIFAFVTIVVGIILKNKEKKLQFKVLLILSFIGLILHFSNLLMPEYEGNFLSGLASVSFNSLLSVNITILPFVLLSKNKTLNDYAFYMGLLGGIFTICYPLDIFGKEFSETEVIVYYAKNVILLVVPLYMVIFGIHNLNIKRAPLFPLVFIFIMLVILSNEIILMESGFIDLRNGNFLQPNYNNSNFVFGPTQEIKGFYDNFMEWLVPKPFKEIMVGEYKGSEKFTPVLWLAVPALLYMSIYSFLVSLVFTKLLKKRNLISSDF